MLLHSSLPPPAIADALLPPLPSYNSLPPPTSFPNGWLREPCCVSFFGRPYICARECGKIMKAQGCGKVGPRRATETTHTHTQHCNHTHKHARTHTHDTHTHKHARAHTHTHNACWWEERVVTLCCCIDHQYIEPDVGPRPRDHPTVQCDQICDQRPDPRAGEETLGLPGCTWWWRRGRVGRRGGSGNLPITPPDATTVRAVPRCPGCPPG